MNIKPLLTAIFFLLFAIKITAQINIEDFGEVSKNELTLKECSFEKDASAMFLFNIENISFKADNYDAKTFIEHRTRIKIFNTTGYKYASVIIKNAKTRYTKIESIDAVIYNIGADGKIVTEALNKDQIFKEKSDAKNHITNLRFTFPNLKPGSVIEYRYKLVKKNSYNLNPWLFQDEIPTLISSCSITTSQDIRLDSRIVAPQQTDTTAVAYTTTKTNGNITKTFSLQKIPSFKLEPYMSSLVDNIERVEFKLSRSSFFEANLQIISSMLMVSPYFGQQIVKPVKGTENAIDSIKNLKNDSEKVAAIFNLVTKSLKWNNEQLFFAEDVEDAWKTKSGSSAEINLLMINLLLKAGVNCFPVLISTRDNGKIDANFPSVSQFNGVDVLVSLDSNKYIIDGTQVYQTFDVPPLNILNRDALVLGGDLGWITISDTKAYMSSATFIKAQLDSTGILSGESSTTFTDYAKAEEMRKRDEDEDQRKQEAKDFVQYDEGNIKIDTSYADTSLIVSDPLVEHLKFHYALTNNDDYYFLNPFFLSMFRKNPFTDNERHSDIDFGCKQQFITYLIIDVPEKFKVEEIPKGIVLRTSDSAIFFRKDVAYANDEIQMRYDFKINNPLFEKENYAAIKQFFDKIYAIINQQILLKKKDNL